MDSISNNLTPCPSNEKGENQLNDLLRRYSEYLNDHKSHVDLGGAMLQMGTKTEFVQKLEQILFNPIEAILNIKDGVDNEVLGVVDKLFKLFISKAKSDNLIETAFRKTNSDYALRYGIVLTEDTFERRNAVFTFLDFYYTLEFAERVPVSFQFIPPELKDRIPHKEYIA